MLQLTLPLSLNFKLGGRFASQTYHAVHCGRTIHCGLRADSDRSHKHDENGLTNLTQVETPFVNLHVMRIESSAFSFEDDALSRRATDRNLIMLKEYLKEQRCEDDEAVVAAAQELLSAEHENDFYLLSVAALGVSDYGDRRRPRA
ncbi:hypothetical protein EVAR_2984_1 [Eumeta japonica]|uniref:Uncharacterized protein n=1 Tax=Eumeta variegata TaxID=151549 RepID=A0A4C1SU87_EUMVA|nr:hypothetical protein EVAR_2984_1 [Eumeta japonica]